MTYITLTALYASASVPVEEAAGSHSILLRCKPHLPTTIFLVASSCGDCMWMKTQFLHMMHP